jgi:hypothetical protein
MRKRKPALAHGLAERGATSKRVARSAIAPDPGDLLEFLSEPVEGPEDDARRLFPGPFASQRYLRSSFVAIASAEAAGDAGAAWLERTKDAIPALREIDRRPTPVEDALFAARDQFRAAARACRHAASMIREARRLVPRRRRALRIVS